MPDELIVVATYPYPIEADMAKLRLEADNIECITANELTSQMVFPPQALGGIKILVRAEDAERAARILAEDVHFNREWQVTEDVPCAKSARQSFDEIVNAFADIGKVTKVDEDALLMEGSTRYYLNQVEMMVRVCAGADGCVVSIYASGHDVRGIAAAKCIKRLTDKLDTIVDK